MSKLSHFYGYLSGSARNCVTRCGSKISGLSTHLGSWHKGIRVVCSHDDDRNVNVFEVFQTEGTAKYNRGTRIAVVEEPCNHIRYASSAISDVLGER